ncbi:MAG: hypothetical protein MZU97_05530 [Bacillus subtilis]|nr:hypothetical protein [Bacillus subtilis]
MKKGDCDGQKRKEEKRQTDNEEKSTSKMIPKTNKAYSIPMVPSPKADKRQRNTTNNWKGGRLAAFLSHCVSCIPSSCEAALESSYVYSVDIRL